MLTNLPDITVGWDPPQSNTRRTSSNRYYYAFNDNPDFAITKRTAPNRPPIDTHQVTSTGLAADDTPIFAHVAAVDLRGRIGPTNRLSFRLDTVPPKNVEVQLPPSTISRSVDLKLGATGARWMYLSNSDYAEGGDWEPWARDITWRLSEGAGTKSVFLRVQDEAGNTADGLSTTELVASQHTIQVTAGPGGAVSPAGQILVGDGADAEFLLLPDDGYVVDTVTIDGVPATTSGNRLIIPGVTSDRALSVTFRLAPATSHVIRVTGGPGGTLTPSGEITVREGESLTIQVAPDEGYRVDTVHLDGRPVRLTDMGDYRFINIDRSYELAVTFGPENG
jgi:hypothetical protein